MKVLYCFYLLYICVLSSSVGQVNLHVGASMGPKLSFSEGWFTNSHTSYNISSWAVKNEGFLELEWIKQGIGIRIGLGKDQHIANFLFKQNPVYPPIKFPNEKFTYYAWYIPFMFKLHLPQRRIRPWGAYMLVGGNYYWGEPASIYLQPEWRAGAIPTNFRNSAGLFIFEVDDTNAVVSENGWLVGVGLEAYYEPNQFLRFSLNSSYYSGFKPLMQYQIQYEETLRGANRFQLSSRGAGIIFSLGLSVRIFQFKKD